MLDIRLCLLMSKSEIRHLKSEIKFAYLVGIK